MKKNILTEVMALSVLLANALNAAAESTCETLTLSTDFDNPLGRTIQGCAGAVGDNALNQASASPGGVGNIGVNANAVAISNNGTITGGAGGAGGNEDKHLFQGAVGGLGGIAIQVNGGSIINSSSGTIIGGAGGNGGSGILPGMGGVGGAGAAAINGEGFTLSNNGEIKGGQGGQGGQGGGQAGYAGQGGVGVISNGNAIIHNYGLIQGGSNANSQAKAIDLNGSNNRLVMYDNASVSGLVTSDGGDTLEFNRSSRGVLRLNTLGNASSAIPEEIYRGFEAYEKTGVGLLELTDAQSSSGSWKVKSGTLELNNANLSVNSANSANSLVVEGGRVSGVGSLPQTTVQSGGVLRAGSTQAAGNPYGTLQVQGNLTFNSGAVLEVATSPTDAQSSKVTVSGTATLAGTVKHVGVSTNSNNDYRDAKTFTILTAATLNGSFSGTSSDYAYLDTRLAYTATEVQLTVERKRDAAGNTVQFDALGRTPNARAVGQAVEGLQASSPVFQYVQSLGSDVAPAALQSLTGESHAGVAASLPGLGSQAASISMGQLQANLNAGMWPGAALAQSDGPLPASAWPTSKALPAWVQLVGNWQRVHSDGNAAGSRQHSSGVFVGGDHGLANDWRVGGALGYTRTAGRTPSLLAQSDVDSYSLSAYAGRSWPVLGRQWNVMAGAALTHHAIETERNVTGMGQVLTADYSARTLQLFGEVGHVWGTPGQRTFEPYVGWSVSQQRSQAFQERGGSAALRGAANHDTQTSSTLGLRWQASTWLGRTQATWRTTLGWRHAWSDVTQRTQLAFDGGQSFTVTGVPLARNTGLLGLKAHWALSRTWALETSYDGEFARRNRQHGAMLKLRWTL